jgi:hypothetical protein
LAVGPDPKLTARVFIDQLDGCFRPTRQEGLHGFDLAALDDIETFVRPYPDAACAVLQQGIDVLARETLVSVVHRQALRIGPVCALTIRADPQYAVARLEHRAHAHRLQTFGRRLVREASINITAEPAVRTEPDAARLAGGDGPDQIAHQPLRFTGGDESAVAQAQRPAP